MCGVFGYVGRRSSAATIVLEGLKSLEYRGYDSWGVAALAMTASKIAVKKQVGKIGEATVDDLPASQLAIGHTRWATHGGVTQANAHPHMDESHQVAIVHNGIVENYEVLKAQLGNEQFVSETDSEVISHLLAQQLRTADFPTAVRQTFQQLAGLNAVAAVHLGEQMIIAARNGSPLVVGYGEGENYLASDPAALLPYTQQVYFLEDGQLAVLSAEAVSIFEVKSGKKLSVTPQTLDWDVSQGSIGEYAHFMLKEMHEQPLVIANIATNGLADAQRLASTIKNSHGSYLIGCGTAAYACLTGTYLFSKIARYHLNWAVGSEFGYQLDFLTEKSVVIALSQSGETMDILESLKKAKTRQAQIVALVNVLGSTLYRLADDKVLLGAGPEKAVASTKAFTAKLAHLILIAYVMAGKAKKGQELLLAASQAMSQVLQDDSLQHIQQLATQLTTAQHLYIIGRGLSYPASLEAALKIKEITYIHAEGFAAGELKHGALALIEKGTPCLVLLPNDETYQDTLAGAMEMKARGGHLIGISPQPHAIFDDYLPMTDVGEASILPIVVTAQLLAYYVALAKGLDPDKPRNLAKSVTVK